ncbi:hypothetical protein D3C71_1753400 [compost metagenome]
MKQIIVAAAAAYREAKLRRVAFERHARIIAEVADHRQVDQHMAGYAVSFQHLPDLA